MSDVVTLYRPTGPAEYLLIAEGGFRRWPPRLPGQPFFYPVSNAEYAVQIARDWNVKDSGFGCVTRFHVRADFLSGYAQQTVGARTHTEWWIPAAELEALNDSIVGTIEVIHEFGVRPEASRAAD
jgi:hypothetical protein